MKLAPRTFLVLAAGVLALNAFPAQGQDAMDQEMAVELVVATGVEDREPVGVAESFPADVGQVHAWLRVTDGAGQAVEVVWSHGENEFVVPLEIGGSPWRTWSSKTIPADWTGPWEVVVRDSEGNVLATSEFTVG